MRCPKCGYNSFDHLENCKKCGKELSEHKQRFGIVSVLFPGQMKPGEQAAFVDDELTVDEDVAVATAVGATATATATAEASDFAADVSSTTESSEGDDFGFDFMGDSDEEEDLSFDELFEEASAEEDVEESLPSPEEEAEQAEAGSGFSFDPESDGPEEADAELEDDFGFDPAVDEDISEEDDFSFETDSIKPDEIDDEGTEEDPKSPFDLPESSQQEVAPESTNDLFSTDPESELISVEEDALLCAELSSEIEAADSGYRPADDVVEAATSAEDEALAEPQPIFCLDEDLPEEPVSAVDIAPESEPASFVAASEELRSESEAFTQVASPVDDESSGQEMPEAEPSSVFAPVEATLATAAVAATVIPSSGEETSADPKNELLPATGNRVAAFCCDLLLLVVVAISFVVAAEAAIATDGGGLFPSLETLIDLSIPYFLVLFSLAFGYFTLFHFLAGQTPGKMLAGLRVETLEGEALLFSQAFLRSVGGLLQVLPVGLGYLVILSSPERRGWNDRLAGTRLVSLRGLPEEL